MTEQEIFDKVVAHARKQGCKSRAIKDSGFWRCLYRGPNGTMCFAGVLIPDEDYCEKMEGYAANCDVVANYFFKRGFTEPQIVLIRNLQEIHDDVDVDSWEHSFVRTAKEYNLLYTPPTEE